MLARYPPSVNSARSSSSSPALPSSSRLALKNEPKMLLVFTFRLELNLRTIYEVVPCFVLLVRGRPPELFILPVAASFGLLDFIFDKLLNGGFGMCKYKPKP